MRKLAPAVIRRSRVRLRHVAVGAACVVAGLMGLAHEIRDSGFPRMRIAQEQEQRILDALAPGDVCPVTDERDPWGDEYQIVCHREVDRVIVTVVSQGEGDGDAFAMSKTFWR